jgi:hypothetical protein
MTKNNIIDTKGLADGKEISLLIIFLPILFVLMVTTYLLMGKLSLKYSKVCNFMGKIWISQAQVTETKREGCYTYEQLAQIKFKEENTE